MPTPWLAALLAGAAGAAQEEALLVRAERVVVRPGVELEDAAVLVQRGRIVAVGRDLEPPEGARVLAGEVVCAGFLDPWSALGLDAGSASDESTSAATRSLDGVDRYARHALEDALRAGVVAARVQAGTGAAFGGIGAVVRSAPQLGLERAVLLEDACVSATVGLPRNGREKEIFDRVAEVDALAGEIESGLKYREAWLDYREERRAWEKKIAEKEKELEKGFKKAQKDREKKKAEAEEKGKDFKEARYKEDRRPRKPKFDADDEVMARVANGELPLVVEVHRAEELRGLLEKTKPYSRLRLVIAGGTGALAHAETLAERGIPVIVWPKPMAGERPDRYADHDLSLAAALAEADVEVLVGSGGTAGSRDLRLLAALAIGHGLDRDEALRAITLGPAEAFDVADRLGSVERGKDADLLVLDGDPFASGTRVLNVVSRGRVVAE